MNHIIQGIIAIVEARRFVPIDAPSKVLASQIVKDQFAAADQTIENVERVKRWLRDREKRSPPWIEKKKSREAT